MASEATPWVNRSAMPRPAWAKVHLTHSVSTLLPLQGVSYMANYTQGVALLALGYELLPLRDVLV